MGITRIGTLPALHCLNKHFLVPALHLSPQGAGIVLRASSAMPVLGSVLGMPGPTLDMSSLFLSAQGVGMVLRVSSATPVLGSALGMLGVGAASATAGQAFRKVRLGFERGGPSPLAWPPWQGVQRQDLLVDAVGGLLIWRVGSQ